MKFMASSRYYAIKLSPLIFDILDRDSYSSVKENIVGGFSDLIICHPNEISTFCDKVFMQLKSSFYSVRLLTMRTLEVLITKEHIKVCC